MINFRKICAMALAGSMLSQLIPVRTGAETIKEDYLNPKLSELVENDYIVYFANCGTQVPEQLNDDDKMGLYQGKVDQVYSVDEKTGLKWGYTSEAPYATVSPRNTTSTSTIKSDTFLYQSPSIEFNQEKSGIFYNFELPEGEYDITVGFKNPWDTRTTSIYLEGKSVEDNVSLTKGEEVVKTYNQYVSDGELNVRVHNPNRSSQYNDPLVNYIIVRYAPEYTLDVLKLKLETMPIIPEDEKSLYVSSTLDAYETALLEAKDIVDGKIDADEAKIEEVYKKLDETYNSLRKRVFYSSFNPDESWSDAPWVDNEANPIQAHGGQVQQLTVNGETKWWWYGEDKSLGYRGGVRAYSSDDLYNWNFEGVVLQTMQTKDELETNPYFSELYSDYDDEQKELVYQTVNKTTSVIERPKVIYNEKNNQYVMWFHADGPITEGGSNYAVASAGLAVSDSPTGPFKVVGRYRLHTGGGYTGNQGMARDMNLFVDDDKTAYIIYSSEENATMYISRLNEDYTALDVPQGEAVEGVDFSRNFVNWSREAPAMFKYDGKYYLMTSGCTGWNPNQAKYAMADSPLGPWTDMGDPCIADTSKTTFNTQSTCIFPVDAENGKFIYMGDRWSSSEVAGTSGDLRDSRYVWLPVEFDQNGKMVLRYYDEWTLEDLEFKGKIELKTELPTQATLGENLNLPKTVKVTSGGQEIETPVTWNTEVANKAGVMTVEGILTELNNKVISTDVIVVPKNLIYFASPSSLEDGENTADYNKVVENSEHIINTVADQVYDPEIGNTWGYTNAEGTGVAGSSDMYAGIRYITKDAEQRDFSYKFEVEAGEYTVYAGYYDPWSQWATKREVKTSINGIVVDECRNITGNYEMAEYKDIVMSEDGVLDVNFAPVNTGENTDIQVSWVMVVSNEDIIEEVVDKSELLTIINEANELLKQADKYTEESLSKLKQAVTIADEVYNNEGASKEDVSSAIEGIKEAIKALEEIPEQEIVDKTELENKISEANELLKATDKYTEESLAKLQEVLEIAKEVYDNNSASREDVAEAIESLKTAINGMEEIEEEIPDEVVDKSKLEAAIKEAKKIDLSKYTKESADNFRKVTSDAEVVLKDKEATESDVENAIKALEEAKKALKKSNTQGSGGTTGGSNSGSSSNNKLPQTGGMPITVIGLVSSVVGISIYKRRK